MTACYSLSAFTGFISAAFMAWQLTVNMVISSVYLVLITSYLVLAIYLQPKQYTKQIA